DVDREDPQGPASYRDRRSDRDETEGRVTLAASPVVAVGEFDGMHSGNGASSAPGSSSRVIAVMSRGPRAARSVTRRVALPPASDATDDRTPCAARVVRGAQLGRTI